MKTLDQKPWFKKWWGILLIIIFFPFLIPYLVWTETKWNKFIKIIITFICIIIFIGFAFQENKNKYEALNLVKEAETSISRNKIDNALVLLKKSQKLYINSESKAFKLETDILNYKSEDFLKDSLISLKDNEIEDLKNNNLNKRYFDNKYLNKNFIEKLKSNVDNRKKYLEEIDKQKKEQEDKKNKEEIDKKVKAQFSTWDGSHIELTKYIKKNLKDPNSYEHIDTTYSLKKNEDGSYNIVVFMKYRAKNSFGGYVIESIKAYYDLDGNPVNMENWVQG